MSRKLNVNEKANLNSEVVSDFGKEWETFSHKDLSNEELTHAFNEYFCIFPFELIGESCIGFDMGCGTGRWAKVIAPRVKLLKCIDPSKLALEQAKENLRHLRNCIFECASVATTDTERESQDFGYCLGVLHHIPDTESGLKNCISKLKRGAPFLLYLYYRFDNKPLWFQVVWKASDFGRRIIAKLPFPFKLALSQVIALSIYLPLARLSLVLEKCKVNVINVPLSAYRNKSLYFMRTDALDRFGTKLEKRFTKSEIQEMMVGAGLQHIRFSDRPPFWVAVGIKA